MRLNTDGLIIKESSVGEDDRLVTVLTRDRGVLRAFVRKARRVKNHNASSTSLLCYSHMTFFQNKDTYTLDEASPIEIFFPLRGDIERLSLAQYFCEVCGWVAVEENDYGALLSLVLNCLHMLSLQKRPNIMIKSIFELRTMTVSGFMPDLIACQVCGRFESDDMRFDKEQGCLCCAGCGGSPYAVPVEKSVLAAMRHIVYSEPKRLFSFDLPDEGLRQLNAVTESYLLTHCYHKFTALEFYKSLV
jgi:DNA repair protein RecO (recombination protein O)